jgi:glycosyltransferase involved in cell wall biosynthesis
MGSAQRTPPSGGAYSRRFSHYEGLFFDEFEVDSAWIRERASVRLPPLSGVAEIVVRGEYRPHPAATGIEHGSPTLEIAIDDRPAAEIAPTSAGPWEYRIAVPAERAFSLQFRLAGTGFTNALAWLGRVTGLGFLQRFRGQNKNRQLRIRTIGTPKDELIFDFAQRHAPYSAAFARQHAKLGLNIVGFLTADLGVGESARCMVRAADAAAIPAALVPLKLNCKNRLGDDTYAPRLQETNPHDVNVIHLDPPAARDIDHHHGRAFRAGKYNIGYFAWELPEFPDAWIASFDYFDEIWCPSDFTTNAVALKSPVPVLTMPHSISFRRPDAPPADLRRRFNLPSTDFLFLSLFDLNSYAARKNPTAVIEAFRRSGIAGRGASLVLKVQNADSNPADFAALEASVASVAGTVLVNETLSRADVYALESACDCFVSLHRSEGFGLAVAECMYLGKPVISTDWSATAEYVNADNGFPVRARLVTLERNYGPYAKGSTWAEADLDHAAAQMHRIASDQTAAAATGARGRQTIESRFSPAAIGARYKQRLESIAAA